MSASAVAATAPHRSSTFKVLAADCRADRAVAARFRSGGRVRQRDGVFGRAFQRTERLFCELPVVRPGTGRGARLFLRSGSVQLADGGSARELGLAGAVFLR